MADTKPKRRMGDRRDGRWVRDVPGLQTIMGHLMPNRTDAEVFMKDSFDVTELLPYLDAKNATMYERYDISLSFVCKRRFQDNGEEALMFFIPKEDETLDSMSYKIAGEVRETRKSESSTDGIDALVDGFAKIPRVLLMGVIRVIRWMDFWGVNHLNNYGTNSIMVTIGTIHKEARVMPDGSTQIRDVVDIGATLDERIADGFYFARSLKLVKYIFAHPELLDLPLNQPSNFDYNTKL